MQGQQQQQELRRYNPENRVLDADVVTRWLNKYGVEKAPTQAEMRVYQSALIHRSYSSKNARKKSPDGCMPIQKDSNERLEFLGDSVLALAVVSYLYERFPDQNEGFMTRMRTKLVNGVAVSNFARHLGMQDWVCVSKEIEAGVGTDNKAILEDAFEAWLGALYINCGFDAAKRWLINFLEAHIDFCDLILQRRDYKDQLFKYFHSMYKTHPVIKIAEAGATAAGGTAGFAATVVDRTGNDVAYGTGKTQKDAENRASKNALKYYGLMV